MLWAGGEGCIVSAMVGWKVGRARDAARGSLWEFANQTLLKRIHPRVDAPHHRVVCDYLQRLADDPDGGILIVLMPPGSAKTLFAGRLLPAWAMGRQPNTKVVMITNSMPLAEANGRAVRDLLATKTYEHIFDSTLSASSSAAASFNATNGSEFFGVGAAGAVLGRRGNWIIIDDPISGFEEAQSETQLKKLHDAFETNILTRMVPGAKLVLICQRLARRDLAGFLMDRAASNEGGRKTTVLRLPMLCDDPDNDPMGRAMGEPLWPAYYTPGMIVDAQADPFIWKTLYMQLPPSDKGTWCSAQDLHITEKPKVVTGDDWRIYIGCDVAHTVAGGDATVFAVMAFNKRSGAMHFLDMYRAHVDIATAADALIDLIELWKPMWVGIDDDMGSKAFVAMVKQKVFSTERAMGATIELVPMKGKNKEERAAALKGRIKSGQVHLDRSLPFARDVLREFTAFPHGTGSAIDDIVDAVGVIPRKFNLMLSKPAEVVAIKSTDYTFNDLIEDNDHKGRGFRPRL